MVNGWNPGWSVAEVSLGWLIARVCPKWSMAGVLSSQWLESWVISVARILVRLMVGLSPECSTVGAWVFSGWSESRGGQWQKSLGGQ